MARKKAKTPEDIIEAIKEKQSEIDDLLYDLEDVIITSEVNDSDFDEEDEIDETTDEE